MEELMRIIQKHQHQKQGKQRKYNYPHDSLCSRMIPVATGVSLSNEEEENKKLIGMIESEDTQFKFEDDEGERIICYCIYMTPVIASSLLGV